MAQSSTLSQSFFPLGDSDGEESEYALPSRKRSMEVAAEEDERAISPTPTVAAFGNPVGIKPSALSGPLVCPPTPAKTSKKPRHSSDDMNSSDDGSDGEMSLRSRRLSPAIPCFISPKLSGFNGDRKGISAFTLKGPATLKAGGYISPGKAPSVVEQQEPSSHSPARDAFRRASPFDESDPDGVVRKLFGDSGIDKLQICEERSSPECPETSNPATTIGLLAAQRIHDTSDSSPAGPQSMSLQSRMVFGANNTSSPLRVPTVRRRADSVETSRFGSSAGTCLFGVKPRAMSEDVGTGLSSTDLPDGPFDSPSRFSRTPEARRPPRPATKRTSFTPPLIRRPSANMDNHHRSGLSPLQRPPPINDNPFSPKPPELLLEQQPRRRSRAEAMAADMLAYESAQSDVGSPEDDGLVMSPYRRDFYQIRRIGNGSFGQVFECVKRLDGLPYAVKIMQRKIRGERDMQNTLKEVFAMAALGDCRYVVRYYNAWVEDDQLYIQTELCSGGNVAERKKTGEEFSEVEILKMIRHVAAGLSHMHAKNVAHLDIKPENIYISDDLYKIGDLGTTTLITEECKKDLSEGDARYIAPEILRDDLTDLPKADIFSLGVSGLELCLGLELTTNGPQWTMIREGRLPNFPPRFSQELRNLIWKMIQPDASHRYTAAEVVVECELKLKAAQIVSEEAESPSTPTTRITEAPRNDELVDIIAQQAKRIRELEAQLANMNLQTSPSSSMSIS